MAGNKIDELRSQIDQIDDQILELLEKRAEVAQKIGHEKRSRQGSGPDFFDPEREKRNTLRLEARSRSLFPATSIAPVFKEIMSACRSLETEMTIAFLGPEGTFTHLAASRAFGQSVQYLEAPSIRSVFDAVERKQAQYGVVPLENSSTGGISDTLYALLDTQLMIRGDLHLTITHCLAGRAAALGDIKKVYSHPQALAQCRQWLNQNLPQVRVIESSSTSTAAAAAAQEPESAAICSRHSADLHHLRVIREGIEDQLLNETRFIILAGNDGPKTGKDRTSVVFGTLDQGSALPQLLLRFTEAGIPVTRIETRLDQRKKWRALCFVDFAGHRSDPAVTALLERIQGASDFFRILGSYPALEGSK